MEEKSQEANFELIMETPTKTFYLGLNDDQSIMDEFESFIDDSGISTLRKEMVEDGRLISEALKTPEKTPLIKYLCEACYIFGLP